MELQKDTIEDSDMGIPTYYYKLVDQYTNRDIWSIAEVPEREQVSTNYLGWTSDEIVSTVNPTLSNPLNLGSPPEEDESAEVDQLLVDLVEIQTSDLDQAIQTIRARLLAFDLILPVFTIFGENPEEIYEIELFDKNFKRFWLLSLHISKISETYQVTSKIIIL